MKKIITCLALTIAGIYSTSSFAQGSYGGRKTLGLTYVGVDKGYGANLNYQHLIGNSYLGYRIDIDYIDRDMNLKVYDYVYKTDYYRYTLSSSLQYNFERWIIHPFNLQIFAGALIGQEKINNGKSEINKIEYINPDPTIYGGLLGVELEMSFSRRLSLVIAAKNTFTNSKIQNSMFNYMFGLKLHLTDY